MIKIAQISRYYQPRAGGQETFIENLIAVFTKNNIETTVFQPPVVSNPVPLKGVFYVKSLPLIYRIIKAFNISDWFLFNWDLKKYFTEINNYDIILCHYSFHYPVFRKCSRVIVMSHGVLWSEQKKTFFDKYLYKQDHQLKNNKNVVIVACDTHYLRTIGYDISPGHRYFEEVFPNRWFIPNCIDTTKFTPSQKNNAKENIILVPRNIRHDRGIHLAIEAFYEFNKLLSGYKMLIVGLGHGSYYEHCLHLVKKFKIEDVVIFIGSIPWDQMIEYYQKAKITLIPTIEKEGTSFSALESMSCGTPVVATNVAGLQDIPCVKTEVNALSIANAMKEVLLNNYSATVIEQRQIVQTLFNIENWSKAWLSVINKIMQDDKIIRVQKV